ncbi:MAG: LytTR family DNA-binding domain-containing protein [Clostridia bacterium]|nr:LytTR family DNA-binding domain-containing protein [Clostridia bacterium]
MNKKLIEKAINETRQCLIHYWHNDSSYVDSYFAEDIMWIGALQRQFIQGRKIVFDDLADTNKTNPVCSLLQQEFWCISNDRNTCTVVGRYYVTTDDSVDEIISEQQRCTFIWKISEGELKLLHMHISSPVGYLEEGEVFPHKIGKATYKYFCELAEKYDDKVNTLKVKDIDGHIRFILMGEIEFAEASGHNTIVCTVTEKITARITWKAFLKLLDKKFVRVHRSYVVQRNYIKLIKPCEVLLISDKKIPVSDHYYKEFEKTVTKEF